MFIKIPFQITNGNIDTEVNLKKSVDNFIDLLVSSHLGHFKSDPEFGFVFKNFSFENFDEKKGTIANSISFFDYRGLYQLSMPEKISKYDLLKLFQEVWEKLDVEISPSDDYFCDKSMVGSNRPGFEYGLPNDYRQMLIELKEFCR